jgi:hypothetical protein
MRIPLLLKYAYSALALRRERGKEFEISQEGKGETNRDQSARANA